MRAFHLCSVPQVRARSLDANLGFLFNSYPPATSHHPTTHKQKALAKRAFHLCSVPQVRVRSLDANLGIPLQFLPPATSQHPTTHNKKGPRQEGLSPLLSRSYLRLCGGLDVHHLDQVRPGDQIPGHLHLFAFKLLCKLLII
jgi:hypothetical protein